jgi:signal transduction histidine kinase/type II secretory pathway pseudopilin PulG
VASWNKSRRKHESSPSFDLGDTPPVWRSPLAIAIVGILITAFLAWWVADKAADEAAADLAARGDELAQSVEGAIQEGRERLAAVAGFFEASDDVTQDEFRTFSDALDPVPGMSGVGYMPIVMHDDLAEYETQIAESIPDFYVFEVDGEGRRIPVGLQEFHVPVQWFEPRNIPNRPHGYDSASDPDRRSALIRARWDKEASVTSFLTLIEEGDSDGFLIYWPIIDRAAQKTAGFAVAPMDLSDLLEGQIDADVTDELEWEIDTLMDGRRPSRPVTEAWATVIDVGSNWWTLTVTSSEGAGFLSGPGGSAIPVAIAGLITSVLAASVFHQYRRKRQTERELEKLRDLTRAKDQFLASVSHELRTPLTGVLGFAELLRSDHEDLSEDERRAMLANVSGEATDLAAIIDDLLVAARSELDLLAITRVPVSFRAQVAQVVETADPTLRDRIEVTGDGIGPAMGDPGRVRQIIRNLITNAARYGGSQIEIRFEVVDEMVHLEVADDGPGLRSDEWERVFEPYYRVDQEASTQPAALGIGLSVARHLARLMEGDVIYKREEGWSVFCLALPSAPVGIRAEQEHSVSIII